MAASGLKPNSALTVTMTFMDGSTAPGYPPPPMADSNGNLATYHLDLLCAPNGIKSVDISGVAPDGSPTATAHADAPISTNPYNGDFVCGN